MNARSEIISVHFGETDSWPPKVVLNSQTQMSMTQNCRAHSENKACCQMRVCLSCLSTYFGQGILLNLDEIPEDAT